MIPDFEQLVVSFLASNPVVAGKATGGISTEIPPSADFPRIRVTMTGSTQTARSWLYTARVTLEAWAESKAAAFDLLVYAAHALETGLEGAQVASGAVTGVIQETGANWSPDPITQLPRYIAVFGITAHPIE